MVSYRFVQYARENITGIKGEDLYSLYHVPELIEQEKKDWQQADKGSHAEMLWSYNPLSWYYLQMDGQLWI